MDSNKLKGRGSFSGGRGSSWTSTVPVPASDIPINSNKNQPMMSRHPSTRINSGLDSDPTSQPDISVMPDARCLSLNRHPSRAMDRASGRFDYPSPMRRLQEEEYEEEEEEDDDEEHNEGDHEGQRKEVTNEEGEEQRPVRMSLMSLLAENDGVGYGMDDEDDDEDEEEEEDGEYNNCCICMVRHKGTAFEPCGHSFCRLCSREMWVQGGNCPLCNNYILEILDIF